MMSSRAVKAKKVNLLPEEDSTTFQIRRATINNTNRRIFSLEKTARCSKFVERREIKQDVQFSDDKQTIFLLSEENSTMFQTGRAATNYTNRWLSSLRKTERRSKLVERQRAIKTFLPEENNTGTSPSEAIQIRVNSSLTVTLAAHFNDKTNVP